jgi:diguanylate cyclase (GGDEF)-like protein/PAS domain S-box-containing protein
MSLADSVWLAVVASCGCAATAWLWRASTSAGSSVTHAYRRLSLVAALWTAGGVIAVAFPDHGATASVTIAGLVALGALVALWGATTALAGPGAPAPTVRSAAAADAELGRPWPSLTALADGWVLVSALFVLGWVACYGRAYHESGTSAFAFALYLFRPVADVIVLAGLCVYLGSVLPRLTGQDGAAPARPGQGRPDSAGAWRHALLPWLALLGATASESLSVSARITGQRPGSLALLCLLAGLALLAAVPLARSRVHWQWPGWLVSAWPGPLAGPAVAAAMVAGLTAIGWGLAGGSAADPAVIITGGLAGLVLAARVAGITLATRAAAQTWRLSGRAFLELAERTSDVVVLCDLDATIRYASPAVARFGYRPDAMDGTTLADLIHPDDRLRGARAVRAAGGARSGHTIQFSGRIRSADGTWHHVEAKLARHAQDGSSGQLLITARDVSDQVALRRQVTHLTFHDGLTGLPNRAYLEERAKGVAQHDGDAVPWSGAAAIFIDLDGFTGVNDSVGHGAGDLLLAQAARRLRAMVPAGETVARWGSDEFTVLVESAPSAQEVVDIAERLRAVIASEPFRVADRDISLTASVGVALADAEPPEHLLRNADVAMAKAKEAGGGRVEVFAAHMHADVVRRLELASDLRRAITSDELELEYQPMVELATSRVVGVEALVRWSRGLAAVPPVEFLSVAEDSGLIEALGEQVLRSACTQAAAWHAAGWPAGVSVNFSLRQVSMAGFADQVLGALAATGLPPAALTLEVTERVLVEGAGTMVEALAELRRAGVRLAIDDFGTGYASLAYLRELPVDIIKIDPSFVAGLTTDPTLAMLTATIVRVGRELGIDVVAEGIEQPEQLELLRGMGCGLGQGYLVARPMTARRIEAFAGAPAGRPPTELPVGTLPGPGPAAELRPAPELPGMVPVTEPAGDRGAAQGGRSPGSGPLPEAAAAS